jgi:glutathione S-transferase
MRLYYTSGACSLAPHIVAREAGIPLELVSVDLATKKTGEGSDYLAVNPKGYVPALRLDDGETLTEASAIMLYLADLRPAAGLVAPAGSIQRYRAYESLCFISSEVHKGFSPLFDSAASFETRARQLAHLNRRYGFLDSELMTRSWLLGNEFTIADAYLYTVTTWAEEVKLDLNSFQAVLRFQSRTAARPSVRAARAAEGLA